MDPIILGITCLLLFFGLLALGMPIGFSFLTAGFIGMTLTRSLEASLNLLSSVAYAWPSTYTLIVLPLFILMGSFAHHSGISKDLYSAGYKWVGRLPGGLAIATTVACTGFAACTGSSLASAATMGMVAYPEMKKFKYSPQLSTGAIAAGGTLGILIPPSTIFIFIGIMTGTSIGRLFIAGIFPGILLSLLFQVIIYWMCRRNPQLGPRGPSFSWRERFTSLIGISGMLFLFLLVCGGIYVGLFTPTEAAAIGSFGAFLLVLVRRRFTWHMLISVLKDTVATTAMILIITIGAQTFNGFLSLSGIPNMITQGLLGLSVSPYIILGIVLFMYIPLGMIMDSFPMILLTIPTVFPLITGLGFDPVWFGVLVCIMCELANITPPVGMNLYIVKGVAGDVSLGDICRGIMPFAYAMLAVIAIITVFPQIALFLPNFMKG